MGTPRLAALVALVLFCFLAGLLSKTALARKLVDFLESTLLMRIPGYALLKSTSESIAGVVGSRGHQPILVWIEESWQFGFLVERVDEGHVAAYVPGAPSPWSGSLYFVENERIRALDLPIQPMLASLRGLGLGSSALLGGRLMPPS